MRLGKMTQSGFRILTDEQQVKNEELSHGLTRRSSQRQLALYGGGVVTSVLVIAQLRAVEQTQAIQWSVGLFAVAIAFLLVPAAEASSRVQWDPENTVDRPDYYWVPAVLGLVALAGAVLTLIADFSRELAIAVVALGAGAVLLDLFITRQHRNRRHRESHDQFIRVAEAVAPDEAADLLGQWEKIAQLRSLQADGAEYWNDAIEWVNLQPRKDDPPTS